MPARSVSVLRSAVVSGGCRVSSLSEFAATKRYATSTLLFPDRDGAQAQLAFFVPADYVSTPEIVLVLGSIGAGNVGRWRVEYNLSTEGQTYDPAAATEQITQNEVEGANPLRLRYLEFLPLAENFSANAVCLCNVIRVAAAAGDTSYAPIHLLDVIFRYVGT